MKRVALISIVSAIFHLFVAGASVCLARPRGQDSSVQSQSADSRIDQEVEIDLEEEEEQVDLADEQHSPPSVHAEFAPLIHNHNRSLAFLPLLAWALMIPAVGWPQGAQKDVQKNE